MLIKKIKLKNIRSYMQEEIKFPEGTTLLSGDIGAGKSTILLAIDFVLFGIRRGELSGSALLRNGSNEGFIILDFSVKDKEISIKRTLKRTNNGIVQDSGYLTINDVTQELTPVELKQRILQILNYPQEMITKKSLIYRYTVYTPQEEMKLILLGEKEDRVQTLRKVLNIDRYKKIKDNSKIVISEIKLKRKELSGMISDLQEKKSRLQEKELEISALDNKISLTKMTLEDINKDVLAKQRDIINFEQEITRLSNLKKEIEILTHKFITKEEQKFKNNNQKRLLETQLLNVGIGLNIDFNELKNNINENEKILERLEKEFRDYTKSITELMAKKKYSSEIIESITKLDFCPLCRQDVSQEHKHDIISKEKELTSKLEDDLKIFISKENELNSKIKSLKLSIQKYKNQEKEYEILKAKQKEAEYKKELITNIKKEQDEIEQILNGITSAKKGIESELDKLKDTEKDYESKRKELSNLQEHQKMIEISLATLRKEHESLEKELIYMKKELQEKEKAKAKLDYYIKLQDWLENIFGSLIDLIERKVMLKVNTEFNGLFQKWFEMLIDSELIKVKLDEEFTPLIEQNGHDIEYGNLSGGEKTATALAYRLALNQVINNLVSSVNTRDIIILDEPTDGFSTEQLEKIKPVLDELKMKQIIIVSHESKIESFADHIIRIEKNGHVSNVVV